MFIMNIPCQVSMQQLNRVCIVISYRIMNTIVCCPNVYTEYKVTDCILNN